MAFLKLDVGILDSTLWLERDLRDIFLAALLMAQPREFGAPVEQIEIDSLQPTGFSVPPGWHGFVPAAGLAIISRAGVAREAGLAVLRRLGEPEAESRSQEFDGRRMIRIDGGFVILNYMRYRDHDYGAAERMRKLRERKKHQENANKVEHEPVVTRNSRNVRVNVTQAEYRGQSTEAEIQEQKLSDGNSKNESPSSSNSVPESDESEVVFSSMMVKDGDHQADSAESIFAKTETPLKGWYIVPAPATVDKNLEPTEEQGFRLEPQESIIPKPKPPSEGKLDLQGSMKELWDIYLKWLSENGFPRRIDYVFTPKRKQMAIARFRESVSMTHGHENRAFHVMQWAILGTLNDDWMMARKRKPDEGTKPYCDWETIFGSETRYQKALSRWHNQQNEDPTYKPEDDWSVVMDTSDTA